MTPEAQLEYLYGERAKIQTSLLDARAQAARDVPTPEMTPTATPEATWGSTMEAGHITAGEQELVPQPGPGYQAVVVLENRLATCETMIAEVEGRLAVEAQMLRQAEARSIDGSQELANRFGELAVKGQSDDLSHLPASIDAGNGEVSVHLPHELPPDPTIGIIALVATATELASQLKDALPLAPIVAELKEMVNQVVELGGRALEELARDDRGDLEQRQPDATKELADKEPEKRDEQVADKQDQQLADKQQAEAAREAAQEAARETALEAVRQAALEAAREAARQAALEAAREAARQAAAQQQER